MPWKSKAPARKAKTALVGLGLVLAAPFAQIGPTGVAFRSPGLLAIGGGSAAARASTALQMKRYSNAQWRFSLDIPAGWNAFPPGPAVLPDEVSSPYEVIRFISLKDRSLAIVYRMPHNPAVSPAESVKQLEASLATRGYSDFVIGKALFGSRPVVTLDFEKLHPDGKAWRTHSYFFADGTLMYVLGFGAIDGSAAPGLYDRMARSFAFDASAT